MKRGLLSKSYDSLTMLKIMADSKVREIKENEEAMEVIQVVMLIAVGVIAIAAVWAAVNGLLNEWWEMITGAKGNPGGLDKVK